MSGNASNNTTAQEVSPSAVKVQFIRPPKSKKVPQLASKATVLPVKANLDRRLSRSTDSVPVDVLNAGGAPPPAPIPSPAFHAFPTQKTMAEVLAFASKTTEQKNDHAKKDSSILGKKGETQSRSSANPSHFPTKEHAFLIQSVESFTIHQYLRAVANLVGASNIWFGSRLSLGRVAVYLSTVKLVDEFMTKHAGIQIGDIFLPARRMVTKANRLVLSNVCPTIPHSTLEDMLGSAMKLVSPMSFVNVGGKDPELSTIYSFRRQIFVVIEESHQLPESLLVYRSTTYDVSHVGRAAMSLGIVLKTGKLRFRWKIALTFSLTSRTVTPTLTTPPPPTTKTLPKTIPKIETIQTTPTPTPTNGRNTPRHQSSRTLCRTMESHS
jgi:hypothetical protein